MWVAVNAWRFAFGWHAKHRLRDFHRAIDELRPVARMLYRQQYEYGVKFMFLVTHKKKSFGVKQGTGACMAICATLKKAIDFALIDATTKIHQYIIVSGAFRYLPLFGRRPKNDRPKTDTKNSVRSVISPSTTNRSPATKTIC